MNIAVWKGVFGDAYTDRNINMHGREKMFIEIFESLPELPESILEIGANIGLNLNVIDNIINARL